MLKHRRNDVIYTIRRVEGIWWITGTGSEVTGGVWLRVRWVRGTRRI